MITLSNALNNIPTTDRGSTFKTVLCIMFLSVGQRPPTKAWLLQEVMRSSQTRTLLLWLNWWYILEHMSRDWTEEILYRHLSTNSISVSQAFEKSFVAVGFRFYLERWCFPLPVKKWAACLTNKLGWDFDSVLLWKLRRRQVHDPKRRPTHIPSKVRQGSPCRQSQDLLWEEFWEFSSRATSSGGNWSPTIQHPKVRQQ